MRGEDMAGSYANEREVHIFHICTKGLENRVVFMDDEDYHCAVRIAAFCAYRNSVRISVYCLMDNHVHFMASAESREDAQSFIMDFKKEYSRYYFRRYAERKVMMRVEATLKELNDIAYMRNCVAYILRNPVEGRIVEDSGQYKWSSISCYFSGFSASSCRPVSSMKAREIKYGLCTHQDLSGSGIYVDSDYRIVPHSFVDYRFVESIFNHSREFFWTRISKVNSARMEYDMAFSRKIRYNDYELSVKLEGILGEWFSKTSVYQLDMRERSKVAGYLHRRMNAGIPQIARLLGLDRKTVGEILGVNNV